MSFNFFLLPCKQGLTCAPYCRIKLQQRNGNSFKAARKKRCLKTYATTESNKKMSVCKRTESKFNKNCHNTGVKAKKKVCHTLHVLVLLVKYS